MNLLDGLSIALLLALVGCFLVMAEVFFPSGGILGASAGAAFLGAIYFAYTSGGVTRGLWFAAAELLLTPVVIYAAFTWLPHTPMGRVLLGRAPTSEEVSPDNPGQELVGRVGVARSKMLPAGAIEIDGRVVDAVSQSQAIEPGEYVKVVEARGNRIVVRRAGSGERPENAAPDDLLARPAGDLGLEDFDFDREDRGGLTG